MRFVVLIFACFMLSQSFDSTAQVTASEVKNFPYVNQFNYYMVDLFVQESGVWYQDDYGAAFLDGNSVTIYKKENGLLLDSVRAISADPAGNMLFMGYGGVVRKKGDAYELFPMNNVFWPMLKRIGEDVWMSSGYPLKRIHYKENDVNDTTNYFPNMEYYNDLVRDMNGDFYLLSHFGYNVFKKTGDGEFQTFLDNTFIKSIHVDKSNNLWLGGDDCVYLKEPGSNELQKITIDLFQGIVWSISSDENGNVFFGTSAGLVVKNGQDWSVIDESDGMENHQVFDVDVSANGTVWVATSTGITMLKLDGNTGGNKLTGIVFHDVNQDGVKTNGEAGLKSHFVKINNGGYVITNSSGEFSFTPVNGVNTVTWMKKDFWETAESSSQTITFNYPENAGPFLQFGLQWDVVHDLGTYVSGNPTRPGFDVLYYVGYINEGSVTASTTLRFEYDANLSFVESSLEPDRSTDTVLEWDINDLSYDETGFITLKFNVPATTPLGTILENRSEIVSIEGETNLLNNVDTLFQTVTGSFDPNDKLVREGVLEENFVLLNTPLMYTIRFQNTGTDTAFTVKIKDVIDPSFELTSLKVLSASHPYEFTVDGRTFTFKFANIKLPDSTTNEPRSHGFIKYSIAPLESVANQTIVKNKAAIYFDFNAPVETNEVSNKYVTVIPDGRVTSVDDEFGENVRLFPNPSRGALHIKGHEQYRFTRMEIIASSGKRVQRSPFVEEISTTNLSAGIYFVRLYSGRKVKSFRIAVE
jgi:uncharacterized repeat protein (TIGR01451 family)